MLIVYVIMVLLSGTVFLGFDPNGVFSMTAFAGMMPVLWMLMMAYTAVFVAIGTCLRSNGAAIATSICLVMIFPTLLNELDFLLGNFGIKISSLWIEANIGAITTWFPAPGGLLMGACVAVVYMILANLCGTRLFCKQDIK